MGATRSVVAAVVVVLGLGTGSCSGKDATGQSFALTQEDVYTLGGELSGALNPADFPGSNGPIGINLACPLGGTLSVEGRDTTYSSSYATADITFGFQGCKTSHFTTTGSFRVTGSVTASPAVDSANALASGELTVLSTNGRFGTCSVDLGVIATVTGLGAPSYTLGGGVCGVNLTGKY